MDLAATVSQEGAGDKKLPLHSSCGCLFMFLAHGISLWDHGHEGTTFFLYLMSKAAEMLGSACENLRELSDRQSDQIKEAQDSYLRISTFIYCFFPNERWSWF